MATRYDAQTTWNDILLRDSLSDVGIIPSPGYPYTSPDIICTRQQQVDPNQFKLNYGQSPGQNPIVNQNNFYYMRGMNLGANPSGGTIYLYWCPSSLIMLPDQWTKNAMQANVGGEWKPYSTLPQVGSGQVSVTPVPFVWTPLPPSPGQHYCTIGALSTPNHPWSPGAIPPFRAWDDFVMWVRNNQNICWRNITLMPNPNEPKWDRLDIITNPGSDQVPILIKAQCTNVPKGTTITLRNDQLGITTSKTISSPNETVYSNGASCPSGYRGYIETMATVAAGQIWPTGATIQTTLYFGSEADKPVACYAHHFGDDEQHPNVLAAKNLAGGNGPAGVLVPVGNCVTMLQP